MDALAVIRNSDSMLRIQQTAGKKQKSPFRYGSAFSRAMSIEEPQRTQIYVSGTAAIDDQGNSLFIGDARTQIIKILEIVDALLKGEGASLTDICDATVFLKKAEDISVYYDTISDLGLKDLPAVCIVADVCREELLFEIDAMAVVSHTALYK
jgi:enamine deaminase RidA (YjgF/YER057c/UK114 family)